MIQHRKHRLCIHKSMCESAGNPAARRGENVVNQEREAAGRIRKAAKALLHQQAEEFLKERGLQAGKITGKQASETQDLQVSLLSLHRIWAYLAAGSGATKDAADCAH